jgi:hypothetical protein
MSWLVDNATTVLIILGIIAAGFILGWRFNGRVKLLGFAVGVLALMGLVFVLTLFVPTDKKQIRASVDAMSDAVVAGRTDDLFKHISKDFAYKSITRDILYEAARKTITAHRIKAINITGFEDEEISRATGTAKVRFKVTAFDESDTPRPFVTRAEFVLEGDQWKLKTMRFYKAFVNTNEEIHLPGIP